MAKQINFAFNLTATKPISSISSFPYNLIAKKKNNFIDYTRKFDRKKFFVHGLTVQFCIQFDC